MRKNWKRRKNNNILILSLRTFDVQEHVGNQPIVPIDLAIERDLDTIRCILCKDGTVNGADVKRSTNMLLSLLREYPQKLQPEVNLYVSGDFSRQGTVDFENLADWVWSTFFLGSRRRMLFTSNKRCFIRVRARIPAVQQLMPTSEEIEGKRTNSSQPLS